VRVGCWLGDLFATITPAGRHTVTAADMAMDQGPRGHPPQQQPGELRAETTAELAQAT
jgi:hypothetical protein